MPHKRNTQPTQLAANTFNAAQADLCYVIKNKTFIYLHMILFNILILIICYHVPGPGLKMIVILELNPLKLINDRYLFKHSVVINCMVFMYI